MIKEEEREAKKEDATKKYVGPSIMNFFGCSPSKSFKSGKMSTIPESKVSSTFLEKKYPLTKLPLKEKVMNLTEEETCSASNRSMDEEKKKDMLV